MTNIDLFELRRELLHILVGIIFFLLVLFVPYSKFLLFGLLIIGGAASFLSVSFKVPIVNRFLCLFERECNKQFPGKGLIFFFLGSLLALQLFSREIALASILILVFADPISHFVGKNFGGTIKINKKYFEGTLVGILAGTIFASFFIPFYIALIGAFFAMFLEIIEVSMAGKSIDDNLLIPLVAGTAMHFATSLL